MGVNTVFMSVRLSFHYVLFSVRGGGGGRRVSNKRGLLTFLVFSSNFSKCGSAVAIISVRASIISKATFVLSLLVPRLSFVLFLRRAVLCYCAVFCVSSLLHVN